MTTEQSVQTAPSPLPEGTTADAVPANESKTVDHSTTKKEQPTVEDIQGRPLPGYEYDTNMYDANASELNTVNPIENQTETTKPGQGQDVTAEQPAEEVTEVTGEQPTATDEDQQKTIDRINHPEVEQADPFSTKFAALSRKDKELREKEAKLQEIEDKARKFQEIQELMEYNPHKALEMMGTDYDKVTQFYLNNNNYDNPQVATLEKQVKEISQQLESSKKEQLEAQQRQKQQEWIDSAKSIATAPENSGRYELVNSLGMHEGAYNVIKNYYQQHQRVLTTEDALELLEKDLEQSLKKVSGTTKLKSLIGVQTPSEPTQQTTAQAHQTPAVSKTLTNSQIANAGVRQPTQKVLDREDSLAAAARLIKWVE